MMIPAKNKSSERQPAPPTRDDLVLLGEFGRAHGLKGEIRLKSFTADPAAIAGYRPLLSKDGRTFIITSVRQAAGTQTDLLVARVEGIANRDQAEALNRMSLFIERERLPEAAEDDEFLYADLIGLEAVDPHGASIGTITNILDYGGGEILEIAPGGMLVPFTRDFVPTIDIAGRRVVVDYAESADDDENADNTGA